MGIRMEDAWSMTPKEFAICVRVANEKRKTEEDTMVTQAYLTACWQRAEKVEPLKDILEKMRKPAQPLSTPEAWLENIKRRNAALGGRVY